LITSFLRPVCALRWFHGLPELPVRGLKRNPGRSPAVPQPHAHHESSAHDAFTRCACMPGLRLERVLHSRRVALCLSRRPAKTGVTPREDTPASPTPSCRELLGLPAMAPYLSCMPMAPASQHASYKWYFNTLSFGGIFELRQGSRRCIGRKRKCPPIPLYSRTHMAAANSCSLCAKPLLRRKNRIATSRQVRSAVGARKFS
jgi:hypothetical protein